MENNARAAFHDKLASRKAEEAAWRRFQAAKWLESLVGPLNLSSQPSEKEFVSCLRNGLVLCNAINKVHPGAVPKVVENYIPLQSLNRESQPLPAYQYFENVKNFLVAVEELKLPAFEASDLERETLEAGSAAKVVDCILALKSYHEFKQINGGNGFYKHVRSPLIMHPSDGSKSNSISSDSCRRLDMSAASEKHPPADIDIQKLADLISKQLAKDMADTKENIDGNLLKKHLKSMLKDIIERSSSLDHSAPMPLQFSSETVDPRSCRACLRKGKCKHRHLFQMQQDELVGLKAILKVTRKEFEELQSQFETDLRVLGYQLEEMSSVALGYHKVLKENRTLYNMVQDLKGNIRVYCRIRPAISGEKINMIHYVGADGSLVILDPLKPKKEGRKVFQFNQVFGPAATQDQVYQDTQPLIRSLLDGYNVCIFAYGQTGSGKTYTMSGPSGGSTKDMGINYLALNDLFQMSTKRKDIIDYDIQVQMVEIYNEQVRDLLVEDSSTTKLEIRSCNGDSGLSLPDAKMHPVKSTADVLNLMKIGEVNRVVSSTAMNNRSSRSHSILTVHVHGKDTSGSSLRSCLHLVDLAGSERVDKSEVTGDRLKEAQYINKSLSCLGDVVSALAQKNSHIPYRNSKLTLLLQDSLGGHAKTLMFAHVSPEADSFGETISTLKFAQRVSTVELGAARANKESSEIMQLREQVENLKKALASKDAEAMEFHKMTDLTPPRMRRLSIESSSNRKSQTVKSLKEQKSPHEKPKAAEKTPPRSNTQFNRIKEPRSPIEKPKAMTEKTPPRVRRLNIDSGSSMKSQTSNPIERKGLTPIIPTRSRRLSLEGPRYSKNSLQSDVAIHDRRKPLLLDTVSRQKCDQSEDPEAASKTYGGAALGSSVMEVYHLNAPKSPTSFSHQKRMMEIENKTQIPVLQLSVAPMGHTVMQSELPQTTNFISSANGRGSQIRKSLRTIGKLINGSDKRNQQHSKEADTPINNSRSNEIDIKSPITGNGRAGRRQSLTGVQGFDRSRRSSLGGKPDSDDPRRNARTPPPVHLSAK